MKYTIATTADDDTVIRKIDIDISPGDLEELMQLLFRLPGFENLMHAPRGEIDIFGEDANIFAYPTREGDPR